MQTKNFCIVPGCPSTTSTPGAAEVYRVDWVPTFNSPPENSGCEINNLINQVKSIAQSEGSCYNNNDVNTYFRQIIVNNIINNLPPEIPVEFDKPDYVILDTWSYNQKKVKNKCPANPSNIVHDHAYLKSPPLTTEQCSSDVTKETANHDHDYSTKLRPACFYTDLRYFCNICKTDKKTMFSFNSHQMTHMKNNEVTCSICHEKFLTSPCLNLHLFRHTCVCDVCGCVVPKVQLRAHQKQNREQMQKETFKVAGRSGAVEEEKVRFCVLCLEEFKENKSYFQHLIRKHGGEKKGKVVRDGKMFKIVAD